MISHTNKSASVEALDRIVGSKGFSQAARAAYLVVKDDENSEVRLLLPGKVNHGKDRTGFRYRIIEEEVDVAGPTPKLEWLGEVELTASEALADQAGRARGASRVEEARDWLIEQLAAGPVPSSELKSRADAAGVSWRAVERAKDTIGARTAKVGKTWEWRMPASAPR